MGIKARTLNNWQTHKLALEKHLTVDKILSRKAFTLQSTYKQIGMPTHKPTCKQACSQAREQIRKQARARGRRGGTREEEERGKEKQ